MIDIYITKVTACSFKGYVLSDQLTTKQLEQLGYLLPIGDMNSNFKVEIGGSFEAYCNHDHECYVDSPIDLTVFGPVEGLYFDLVEGVDFDSQDVADQIIYQGATVIWQDWYEGLADAYEYSMVDR